VLRGVIGIAIAVVLGLGAARAADAPLAATALAFPAATTAKVVDKYLVPRFEKFQKASAKLADDLDATCSGKPKRLSTARDDFDRTVLAWAEIEFLRFGPMAVTGRPERISFWPDPRGLMQRQLGTLTARRDAAALEPGALAGKSVAIQGLPALESLLTAKAAITADDEDGRYRCRLAVAIAKNVQSIAGDLVSDWGGDNGWRARMIAPGPDNPTYKSPAEAPAEFARALVTGLQMIQDRQLGPLIAANAGNAPAAAKPPKLPFAAAGLSGRFVGAEVGSLRALYETMGLGRNVPEQKAWMPHWIVMAWERLARDAPAAIEKGPGAKGDPDRERDLRFVRFHLEGIRKLIGRELAPLAGLTIGFNELDGD
jgi:predicted lipoprotein